MKLSIRWLNYWKDLLPSDIQQYFNFALWLTEDAYIRKLPFLPFHQKFEMKLLNPIYNIFILYLNLSMKLD